MKAFSSGPCGIQNIFMVWLFRVSAWLAGGIGMGMGEEHSWLRRFIGSSAFGMMVGSCNDCVRTPPSGGRSLLDLFDYRSEDLDVLVRGSSLSREELSGMRDGIIGVAYDAGGEEHAPWRTGSRGLERALEEDPLGVGMIFQSYLKFYFYHHLVRAVGARGDTRGMGKDDEGRLVENVMGACYSLERDRPDVGEYSLASLEEGLRSTYGSLARAPALLDHYTPRRVLKDVPLTDNLSEVTGTLNEAVYNGSDAKQYFLMFNAVHELEPWQMRVVNGLVVGAMKPYAVKMTASDELPSSSTTDERRPVGSSDMQVLYADEG